MYKLERKDMNILNKIHNKILYIKKSKKKKTKKNYQQNSKNKSILQKIS